MSPLYRLILSSFLLPVSLSAASAQSSKDAYSLFSPTPREEMRELSTDRPDRTESPYSVDAGHFQVEADVLTFSRDHNNNGGEDTVTRAWGVGVLNLKAGLTNDIDLQVVLDNYQRERVIDRLAGTRESTDGFGDTTVRLKYNLWGNDEGNTALAIMPFIKLPTNSNDLGNDDVEGGIILPYAIGLGDNYGLGLMTEVDIIRNESNEGYSPSFVNTATIGVDLTERLASYYEIATERNTDINRWLVTFDTGITYAATETFNWIWASISVLPRQQTITTRLWAFRTVINIRAARKNLRPQRKPI
ncbi:MAG: transporter [Rickettsiales bacterium]|nr:transporter [Rickettsiales bacterium]